MEKLKPCPFCGKDIVYTWHNEHYLNMMLWGVKCWKCGAMMWGFPHETEKDVIRKWNKRSTEVSLYFLEMRG